MVVEVNVYMGEHHVMKALVTGGAGFIGSHLCEELLERGHEVCVLDDLSTGKFENIEHLDSNPRFRAIIDTVLNEQLVEELTKECDTVFHLAAAVGVKLIVEQPVRTIETNIMGTEVVLNNASRYRRRVLLVSTSEVYGKSERAVFSENDDRVMGPTSASRWSYATTKAVDEFLALAYWRERGLPVVIARLFNVVGPRQTGRYGMVIPRFVEQALRGEPLTVYADGQQTRCFGYVGDVVPVLIDLIESPGAVGEIFNIGSTEEITIEELARKVIALCGSDSVVKFVPYEDVYGEGFEDMHRRVPDITKVRRHIDYSPKSSLDDTIETVIEYFRCSMGL